MDGEVLDLNTDRLWSKDSKSQWWHDACRTVALLITRVGWHCERGFPEDCSHVLWVSILFSRCVGSIRSHQIPLGNWSQSSQSTLFTASSSCERTKSSNHHQSLAWKKHMEHEQTSELKNCILACYSHFTSCVRCCEVMDSWTGSCPWQFSITVHHRLSVSPKRNYIDEISIYIHHAMASTWANRFHTSTRSFCRSPKSEAWATS